MVTADTSRAASGPPVRTGPSVWLATLIFVALTAVLTWPQAIHPASVPEDPDSYFTLWRLAWFAHQLPLDARHLFDANIFYPAKDTLAFSDAVLLQGIVSAPFQWLGVPVVLVYNVLVLGSFVLCGVATFLLVRDLTGRGDAAILAGIVFAFATYRFDHYFHLELLWAHWIPLTLRMLHRAIESGRVAPGVVAGLFGAALGFSCIYYTVFLATVLIAFVPVLIHRLPAHRRRRAARAVAAGAIVAAVSVAPYVLPYETVRTSVGERDPGNVVLYGAGPAHYLATTPGSIVYGSLTARFGRHEKRLFPGAIAIVLALVGLLPTRAATRAARTRAAYLVMLAIAFDISFGQRGLLFNFLRQYAEFYRGLRVPARVAVLVLLSVAVFAGVGAARLAVWCEHSRPRWRATVLVCVGALMVGEYLVVPLPLVAVPTTGSDVYRWLRRQPAGVVAELPMLPGHQLLDAEFEYFSSFHWHSLLNGYSGNAPPWYEDLLEKAKDFPSVQALAALRAAGAQYLLVHERFYGRLRYAAIVRRLDERTDLARYGPFDDGGAAVCAYRLLPAR